MDAALGAYCVVWRHTNDSRRRRFEGVSTIGGRVSAFGQFLQRLNNWADKELVPSHSTRWPYEAPQGGYSLPVNLQLRGLS